MIINSKDNRYRTNILIFNDWPSVEALRALYCRQKTVKVAVKMLN